MNAWCPSLPPPPQIYNTFGFFLRLYSRDYREWAGLLYPAVNPKASRIEVWKPPFLFQNPKL